MQKIFLGLGGLLLIGASLFFILNSREEVKIAKERDPDPLVVRITDKANVIEVDFADNKQGDALRKKTKQSPEMIWRCFGMKITNLKGGKAVEQLSFILGRADLSPSVQLEDKLRTMYNPIIECTFQTSGGNFVITPVNARKRIYDDAHVRNAKNIITAFSTAGYKALAKKYTLPDVTLVDAHQYTALQQKQAFSEVENFGRVDNLTCQAGGKAKNYTLTVLKNFLELPVGECVFGIYSTPEVTVWSLKGPAQDGLVLRLEI